MSAEITVAIFAFTLAMQEYVYAATFVSSSPEKPVTLGVVTDLIRLVLLILFPLLATWLPQRMIG